MHYFNYKYTTSTKKLRKHPKNSEFDGKKYYTCQLRYII